ncbi:hypothetical protein QA596_12450 [Balneolales bacterium ANBcel1]|nr:hypothetical protein [Balneolales bacterium ANBcel1]
MSFESDAEELFSQMNQFERHQLDGIVVRVGHDASHLFVMVDFVNARLYQRAKNFGFTLFIDGESSFQRSFGITYPTGFFYELGNYSQARKRYLEEPNWENMPENRHIVRAARNTMAERALLIQRRGRRDNMQPAPVPLVQLRAQNLYIHHDDEEHRGRLFFAVPLQVRSTSQFSPDIRGGKKVTLGFEVDPITLLDKESAHSAPLITSESASGRTGTASDRDQEHREHIILLQRRMGDTFSKWIEVTFSNP